MSCQGIVSNLIPLMFFLFFHVLNIFVFIQFWPCFHERLSCRWQTDASGDWVWSWYERAVCYSESWNDAPPSRLEPCVLDVSERPGLRFLLGSVRSHQQSISSLKLMSWLIPDGCIRAEAQVFISLRASLMAMSLRHDQSCFRLSFEYFSILI